MVDGLDPLTAVPLLIFSPRVLDGGEEHLGTSEGGQRASGSRL